VVYSKLGKFKDAKKFLELMVQHATL
jgi:pentatricopeptide repeat protein